MKDLIDKRNEKEKIKHSIIKSWNVNYLRMSPQKIDPEPQEEKKKPKKGKRDYTFNEKTGAYSGLYGQTEVDQVNKGQIEKILKEKTDELRDLIENGGK